MTPSPPAQEPMATIGADCPASPASLRSPVSRVRLRFVVPLALDTHVTTTRTANVAISSRSSTLCQARYNATVLGGSGGLIFNNPLANNFALEFSLHQ